jgi:isocitrate dehydrogenase kinase/phosphatase
MMIVFSGMSKTTSTHSHCSIAKQNDWGVRMADTLEYEALTAPEAESPAGFLLNLSNAFREKEDVDVGLANILAKHLLIATPAADAVAKAKDAILKLAAERANLNPLKPEVADG